MSPFMHRRTPYLLAAFFIFIAEVLIGTIFSSTTFIRGSVGDFLVVPLIYCIVQATTPCRPAILAAGVFIFACLIEVAQYFQLATLLHLQKGSLPYILLGNTFSLLDILMYFLGAISAFIVDRRIIHRRDRVSI